MSNTLTHLIGRLVVNGYTASFHEGNIYLHDSQGKRWAEIVPAGVAFKVIVGSEARRCEDMQQMLAALEELA